MGTLKEEMSNLYQLVKHGRFVLEIKLDNVTVTETEPFRINSSFSQLPTDWKLKRRAKENSLKE